jgi:vitamin K-dependent gamma-carboxylase-like protein
VRISLSIAGLVNLIDLWPHRFEYFAQSGMIPLQIVREATRGGLYGSVFFWVSSDGGVTAIFLGAALALVTLGAGVWTRASATLVFAWHASYSVRAVPVLHSWDSILRIYSLIMLISPAGRVWSLAHLLRPLPRDQESVPAYGLRLMQWQVYVLYLTTVWLKVPDPFWRSGQMLAYFSVSLYSRAPSNLFLIRHEWISSLGTYLSLAIEASVPWLLSFRRTRPLGFVGGLGFHLAIAVTAKLAIFSLCMIPPYMSFLDRLDIDWAIARLRAGLKKNEPYSHRAN